jgi:LuxR family transcriptional regulator, activator of conjugal transfer of Ti plasmids
MRRVELSFQEFTDAIQTAADEAALERVAARISQRLCFRWFAYLSFSDGEPTLISSYPTSWTRRYFANGYEQIDPVVLRAKRDKKLFAWSGTEPEKPMSRKQRHFFDEAAEFGIRTGVTVPIRGGFDRIAAFTFATEEHGEALDRLINESADILQLVGLYFHTHALARLTQKSLRPSPLLSQRERQCLAWSARGKTMEEIANIIGISPRTVVFHLDNARRKLDASSLAQCVATATRLGLLP